MVVGGWLLDTFITRARLDTTVALAVYTAEIQVFATVAALTPIFFIFAQMYWREEGIIRETTQTAIGMMGLSVFGIIWCIGEMVRMSFDTISVLTPLLMLLEVAILLSLFLLSYAGYRSAQQWLEL